MVDLPFSLPFYQWLLREESTLTSQDLRNIDPTIASTISQLEGKNLSIIFRTCVTSKFCIKRRVSVQGVKSLGGHFASLCRGFEFYEVKKILLVLKKKGEIL